MNSTATGTAPQIEDSTNLRRKLNRSLRIQKLQALLLIAPLLIFILVSFLFPIADMLFRSVENKVVSQFLPRTVSSLEEWDPSAQELPDERVFRSIYADLVIAVEQRRHTRVGTRLNYESPGIASLFRKAGRGTRNIDVLPFTAFFGELGPNWLDSNCSRSALRLLSSGGRRIPTGDSRTATSTYRWQRSLNRWVRPNSSVGWEDEPVNPFSKHSGGSPRWTKSASGTHSLMSTGSGVN